MNCSCRGDTFALLFVIINEILENLMEKTNFYNLPYKAVKELLHTDTAQGLTEHEAMERLREYGYNEFKKREHTTLWQKFVAQFKSFMIIVLLIAAAISGVTGYMNGEGITDALIILVILVANAIIGMVQESKAERSLDALERMAAPRCKVVRDGERRIIESRELVPGDIVEIETGDSIPADLRLTEAINLKVQEAALTGESVPVEKSTESVEGDASIGDRVNMAFASCSVTYGRGRGIVVATGTDSEMGKIAAMIESVPEMKTPMQVRLDQLGRVLAIVSLVVCGIIFIIGLCYGRPLMEMFMTAVSLALTAVVVLFGGSLIAQYAGIHLVEVCVKFDERMFLAECLPAIGHILLCHALCLQVLELLPAVQVQVQEFLVRRHLHASRVGHNDMCILKSVAQVVYHHVVQHTRFLVLLLHVQVVSVQFVIKSPFGDIQLRRLLFDGEKQGIQFRSSFGTYHILEIERQAADESHHHNKWSHHLDEGDACSLHGQQLRTLAKVSERDERCQQHSQWE